MKKWIPLTDEYVKGLKNYSRHKVRFPDKKELWARWDERERCFFLGATYDFWGAYMNDPQNRPTHIQIGK